MTKLVIEINGPSPKIEQAFAERFITFLSAQGEQVWWNWEECNDDLGYSISDFKYTKCLNPGVIITLE